MNDKNALIPIDEKIVNFYEDEIVAVLVNVTGNEAVYVPVRPICDYLGIAWNGQYERIQRDPVLAEVQSIVRVTRTMGGNRPHYDMLCLPLDYLNGWLFGINANRVKKEDLRERIIRYQKNCYQVLAEAFREGRLTTDDTFNELLQSSSSEAVEAYKMLQAMVKIARNQIMLEAKLDAHDERLTDYEKRLETIEAQFGDETRTISEDQASQISQSVKAIAIELAKHSHKNEYGAVYGELYRKFGVTSYKMLPASKYMLAMNWLREWHQTIVDTESPF